MAGYLIMIDQMISNFRSFLEAYGWFLLFGTAFCYYLWSKFRVKLRASSAASDKDWEHKKFDTSQFVRRQETMETARQRFQDNYNVAAAQHAEKQKELEEKRLKEKVEDWENHKMGKGYKNKAHADEEPKVGPRGSSSKKEQKKPLRGDDYNPLTGTGGSCGIRPSRGGRFFGGSGGG